MLAKHVGKACWQSIQPVCFLGPHGPHILSVSDDSTCTFPASSFQSFNSREVEQEVGNLAVKVEQEAAQSNLHVATDRNFCIHDAGDGSECATKLKHANAENEEHERSAHYT